MAYPPRLCAPDRTDPAKFRYSQRTTGIAPLLVPRLIRWCRAAALDPVPGAAPVILPRGREETLEDAPITAAAVSPTLAKHCLACGCWWVNAQHREAMAVLIMPPLGAQPSPTREVWDRKLSPVVTLPSRAFMECTAAKRSSLFRS